MTKIKSDRFEEIQINGNLYRVGEKIGDEHIYNLFTAKSKKPSNYVIKINIGKTRKERFENEILTLSSIKTNSIIKIVKDGNIVYNNTNYNDIYRYYVTKKYDCDFREVMNEKMTINQKLQLFLQMCRSVKYIHKRNIIHRDIKPENFLYDRKRKKVILCDFGISKDFKKNNNLTLSSEKIANSNYCSPEQRKKGNKNFGYYTDIYALGIILNELITNESGYGINYKRVFDIDPSFGELDNVIDRMIAYNFKERENNINNVIYSINKIIKNKSKEIAIHKRNINNNNSKLTDKGKIIYSIFAKDCYSIKQALIKYDYKSLDFYYHNNIKYQIINDKLIKYIKIIKIYNRIKQKFEYESNNYSNNYNKCSKAKLSKFELFLQQLISDYKLGINIIINESLYYFKNLSFYHADEISNEAIKICNEVDKDVVNMPICVLCYEIIEADNLYNIDNLSKDISPILTKSTHKNINNNLVDILQKKEKIKDMKYNIEKFNKNIIVEVDKNFIKIEFAKKSKNAFVNKCMKEINADKQYRINSVYINDILNDISNNIVYIYENETIDSLYNIFE